MEANVAPGQTRAVDIIGALRERIANQELAWGTPLREAELSVQFGVSRARIREAFGALEQRGLIERIPNRGAVVARLEPGQIYDLFDVREMLEGLCARLATNKAPRKTWLPLIKTFGPSMEEHLQAGRLDAYLKAVETLQETMIAAAENPLLKDQLDAIGDKTRLLIRRIIILPGRARQGLKEHRRLLKAMQAGDSAAAERLKRRNIVSSRAYLERYEHFLL